MKNRIYAGLLLLGLIAIPLVTVQAADDCDKARERVIEAYDLGQSGGSRAAQQRLLEQALALCPAYPEAHNNLAHLLEEAGNFDQAVTHYRQALPLAVAWYGIGSVEEKRGRLALALNAYLQACRDDPDAQRRVRALLQAGQYRVSEAGQLLDKESLLLLFDRQRRGEMTRLMADCGFKASVEPVLVFRNITFEVGAATLRPEALTQIREIGAALLEVPSGAVRIGGHTDRQPFQGRTTVESDALNRKLSQERAVAVARELSLLGVPAGRLTSTGYGPDVPEDPGNNPEAHARNRRVVIEVQ